MKEVPIYIVDAFTEERFKGNPAAVCPLSEWLDDDLLQSIASENNLSETAFFVKNGDIYELRWFTPKVEVDLCGHATLASAHILFEHLGHKNAQIVFETKSGRLTVKRNKELYLMDFPAINTTPEKSPKILEQCLGEKPTEVLMGPGLYLVVFDNEELIKGIDPDFNLMEDLKKDVIVTARGHDGKDFVSRCFAPHLGIPEDPVTGYAHCVLAPFWAGRLGKTTFYAQQLSKRGGELYCEYTGDRVIIGGKAVTFSLGRIILEKD
ncbi:MAG: isomerase [Bacteroides sp. SM23_62]|nr:MAG: isomerase [Bacteroides sp. SM23_62]